MVKQLEKREQKYTALKKDYNKLADDFDHV